jgi:hypothetical protein
MENSLNQFLLYYEVGTPKDDIVNVETCGYIDELKLISRTYTVINCAVIINRMVVA